MDKEKEIALLADILCEQCSRTDLVGTHSKCLPNAKCHTWNIAERVINAGYRKMDEVTLKLDLGDRTPEEIKRITEQLSKALNEAHLVISLSDNEIRKQAVTAFAERLKNEISHSCTHIEIDKTASIPSYAIPVSSLNKAIDELLKGYKYGK